MIFPAKAAASAAELGGGSSGCATTVIRESLGSVSGLGQFSGYYRWLARQCRYDMRITHVSRLAKRRNSCDFSLGAVAT